MNMLHSAHAFSVSDAVQAHAQSVLNELVDQVTGIRFAMLCSSDGFEVAVVATQELHNGSRVAAVSSSILAMVSAFISEINLEGFNTITLDATNGKVMLAAVENPHRPMVLVVSTASDVLIGQMNFYIKKAVEALVQLN